MTTESRARRWRRFAVEAAILIAFVVGIRTWQQREMVSGPAPALQDNTLAGQRYELPSRPEHPVLVHFWATWCPVCRTEEGSIADIAEDHPDMITIAMQSGKDDEVGRYMKEHQLAFPVINDADGRIAAAWGVRGVPSSFFIGTDGVIRYTEVGYTTEIGMRLRLWLAGK